MTSDRGGSTCRPGRSSSASSSRAATFGSLIARRRTTCLPGYLERIARLGTFWLGDYARTYRTYVEDQVRGALDDPARQLERGPLIVARGTATRDRGAFVVVDSSYVSGRWLGDAYLFARTFRRLLEAAPVP